MRSLELEYIKNIVVDALSDAPLNELQVGMMSGAGTTMSDKRNEHDRRAASPQPTSRTPKTITSRDLFGTNKLVIIRHDQEDYRLQITSAGKLILTK